MHRAKSNNEMTFITTEHFFLLIFLVISILKKGRTGGRLLLAKSATHWHRRVGEPRATNGQAQKNPCRPPQVDHKRKQGRLV